MCICSAFMIDEVKLYTVRASDEAREAEAYLSGKGIRHEILDPSANEQVSADMEQLSGQTSRPVIVVGDRVFVGFDVMDLEEVMP